MFCRPPGLGFWRAGLVRGLFRGLPLFILPLGLDRFASVPMAAPLSTASFSGLNVLLFCRSLLLISLWSPLTGLRAFVLGGMLIGPRGGG